MSWISDNNGEMNKNADGRDQGSQDRFSSVIEELLADAGLPGSDEVVRAALSDLARLADRPPPQPSPELAAVLRLPASRPMLHRPRVLAAGGVAALALAGISGAAAAADRLPVSPPGVIRLIVDDGRHEHSSAPGHRPAPARTSRPATSTTPAPDPVASSPAHLASLTPQPLPSAPAPGEAGPAGSAWPTGPTGQPEPMESAEPSEPALGSDPEHPRQSGGTPSRTAPEDSRSAGPDSSGAASPEPSEHDG